MYVSADVYAMCVPVPKEDQRRHRGSLGDGVTGCCEWPNLGDGNTTQGSKFS